MGKNKEFVSITQNLKLTNQWHPTKNNSLKPRDVPLHSDKLYWWYCKRINPDTKEEEIYEWQESPASRNAKKEKFPSHIKPTIISKPNVATQASANTEKTKLSPMATMVYDILKQNGLNFEIEHSFSDMPYNVPLPYDFFINNNCLIEIDGPHHFTPFHQNKKVSDFEKRIRIDNLKNDYCINKNIPLLRVPNIFNPEKDREKVQIIIMTFIKTKEIPTEIKNVYSLYGFSNYMRTETPTFKTEERKETNSMSVIDSILNKYFHEEKPYRQIFESYKNNEISYDMAINMLSEHADGSSEWLEVAENIEKIKEDRKMKYYAHLYAGKKKREMEEATSEIQKLRKILKDKEVAFLSLKNELGCFSF